eukprot:Selendium_serpulae@DN6320_c0_g1_i2.p1
MMDCVRLSSKKFNSGTWGNKMIRKHAHEIAYWAIFICVVIVGYKFFSDGSFSAILTLSSAFQFFAFAMLLFKAKTQHSVAGVSRRSLILFLVSLIFRLFSTLFFNGYLPVDRSGDWVYQLADCFSVGLILLMIRWMSSCFSYTYQKQHDSFNMVIPVIAAAVIAAVVHPDLNNYFPADFAWTFALYLETFSMVPQLFMMTKIGGEVEALTSHYVASVAASKFFACVFWFFSFKELAPAKGFNYAGWAVMAAFGGQMLMFADFIYHYVSSYRLGRNLIIPGIGV